MRPTEPLDGVDPQKGSARLIRSTGAELWHADEGDLHELRGQAGPSEKDDLTQRLDAMDNSGSYTPTLVDPDSPSHAKIHFSPSTISQHPDDDADDSESFSSVDKSDPVPWGALAPLCAFAMADAMTYSVLFPIITDMLTSFEPPIPKDQIGLYAGIGEGMMMLVEAVCSPFWAKAADKYGRRRCLVWGFSVTVLGSLGVGWARGVVWIIFCRAILGLNPSGVLTRLVGAELSTPSNRARIFSILSPSFSIGMLFGSVIGGELAHPYGRLPAFLGGQSRLLRDSPFALPCLTIAALDAAVVIFGWCTLKETLKKRDYAESIMMKRADSFDAENEDRQTLLPSDDHPSLANPHPTQSTAEIVRATLRIPSFVLLTAVFLLFQVSTMSWDGMYAVYTYTSVDHGGLGLSVDTIGVLYGFAYAGSFMANPLILPRMTKRYGAKRTLMFSLSCWLIIGALVPITQKAAEAQGTRWGMWIMTGITLVLRALGTFGWALCDVLTLSCFDDHPELMATSSAISCIGGAGGRALGPAISGWMYSIASEQPVGSWGRQISWIYIIFISSPALVMAWRIPESADKQWIKEKEAARRSGRDKGDDVY